LPILTESGVAYKAAGRKVQAERSVAISSVLDEALRGAFGTYDFAMLLHAIEELETVITARETPSLLPEYPLRKNVGALPSQAPLDQGFGNWIAYVRPFTPVIKSGRMASGYVDTEGS